jgi:hypothetical protein
MTAGGYCFFKRQASVKESSLAGAKVLQVWGVHFGYREKCLRIKEWKGIMTEG